MEVEIETPKTLKTLKTLGGLVDESLVLSIFYEEEHWTETLRRD